MKQFYLLKKIIFCFSFVLLGITSYSQNAIAGAGFTNGWPSACNQNTNFGYFSSSISTTFTSGALTPRGTGNQFWRMATDWDGTVKQMNNGSTSDAAVAPGTKYNLNTNCQGSGAFFRNVTTTNNRYVFKTLNAGSNPTGTWVFFELGGNPSTISTVTQSPVSSAVTAGQSVTVTTNLSANLPSGQGVYLRYTKDNYANSTIVELTGIGTSYTATIPASFNTQGSNVSYYLFTSGSGLTITPADADLYTINWNSGSVNGGSNYLYTVQAAPPTITLGANPTICRGITSASLSYSAITNSPNRYSLVFDVPAGIAGFQNVTDATLPASPISITVPALASAATYNATLTVRNSTTGGVSSNYPITITVAALPNAGTLSGNQSICVDGTSTLTSNGDGGGSWTTSNDSVATVSSTGVVTGVAAGSATITYTVTNASNCTSTTTLSVTVTSNTTASETISACGTYTWSVNGQTYNTSGTYTNTTNCLTSTLNLIITPSTSSSESVSVCDTYTWSVNGQTYTTSGTYTNTTNCHTSTLNLTITPSTSSSQTVSACDTYTWSVNGQTYTESGTYTNTTNCQTSTLNLTITPSTSSSETVSVCDTYTWSVNGQTYTTSGTYTNTTNCHTTTLNLTVTPSTSNSTTTSACDSYTWSVNNQTYTQSGTYTSVSGCHTETLVLTIYLSTPSSQTLTSCDSYTWPVNGQTYTSSGTYVFAGTNAAGCPQNITLHLTINASSSSSQTEIACDTFTWSVNNQTYTTSGTYTVTGTNAAGCPDTKTLVLTINNSTSSSQTETACDTYTWSVNNQTYTASGTYTFVGTNTAGCTDTKTLVLTITPSTSGITTISACDTYTWSAGNGQTYTQSGNYTYVAGCHTQTLALSITPSTSNTTTATECDTYTWSVNGQTYTTSGTRTVVTECHTEILNLTINSSTSSSQTVSACDTYTWSVNGQTYTSSGTYSIVGTNAAGCTDTKTLNLTINSSTSSTQTVSACDSYIWSVNGQTYTSSGTYTSSSTNAAGCPDTKTLVLTISSFNTSNAGTTWVNGQNDNTVGFGPWNFTTVGGTAGFFSGSSDVNNGGTRSWGMFASGGSNVTSATRTANMSIGNTLRFSMDNGFIDNGKTVGFGLQNATGQNLMEVYFTGGQSFYSLNDNAGANPTAIGYTGGGLDFTISYTALNTYSITIRTKAGVTATYISRTFAPQSGGQRPAQIRFFNAGAGTGSSYDLFFNSLAINNPVITDHPSTTAQGVCLGATPSDLSVTATGTGLTYQWYSNTTASYAGSQLIAGATSSTITPSTTNTGTLFYYCVVTGGCGSSTSLLSAAIIVTAPSNAGTITGNATLCQNQTSQLSTDGNAGGTWSSSASTVASVSVTGLVTGLTAGTATISYLVNGNGGCPNVSSSLVVNVNALPIAGITNNTGTNQITCAVPSINVTATGDDTYSWSNGSSIVGSTANLTIMTDGTYTVTVTNSSGCQSTTSIVVTEDIAATSSSQTETACDSYTWSVNNQTYTESGTYTVTGTNAAGCVDTKTLVLTITPSSDNITTITACDSYTWNGTTYNASGMYTGTTTNCVTEKLALTITPSSDNISTITACDSYTWNGSTYNASGLYTGTTTNCVTEKLALTITPSSDNITTITACDSYTWNGTTYNASGLYTGTTTNCVTEKLALTITPSSNNITTITACDNYTWNGTVYNTSGIYTGTTTNCVTEKLALTITPSSDNITTITACDSYTWNGTTYNASGFYTGTTTNCVTEKLDLTITPSSDNITTVTACDSYTWSVTGQTYTASGIYTGTTSNCVTEKLDLTIDSLSITTQPTSPTICKAVGASASISVVTAGASPTYQWFVQAPTGTSWTALANNANYAGVAGPTLTITRTTTSVPATGTKYRVAVTNACLPGGLFSANATLLEQTVLSKAATITAKSATNGTLSPALTTCQNSSVNLTLAAGSVGNIQWQSSIDGTNFTNLGTPYAQTALSAVNPSLLLTTGNLTQDTWFRVVASNGVCNSVNGVAIKITVSLPAFAGTITGGDVTVCGFLPVGTTALDANGNSLSLTGITNSTVLTLNGNTGIVAWQRSTNVLTSATPTWSAVTTGVVGNQLTATNLTADTWYRVLVKNGACSTTSAVTKITVNRAAKAGAITSPTTVCEGDNITFTSAAYTGSSIAWEFSSTSTTAGFITIPGENGLVLTLYNVGAQFLPSSKFYVRSVVTSGDCTLSRSAVRTVTVNPPSVAGTIRGGGILCANGGSTVSVSGYTGKIQWEYSTDGTSYFVAPYWKTVSGVPTYFNPNGTTEFATAASTGVAPTYVFSSFNASGTVYFRARIKSGACSEAYTGSVQYVNGSAAVAGTISPLSATICPSTGTTLTLTGSVGAIQWQKATISATTGLPGTFANISGQTGTTLATGNLTASTAYQAVVTIGSCSTITASYVSVFVVAKPITKTITSVVTSPTGSISAPLCTNNPLKVLTIGAGSTGTIQWQTSTTSASTGFTDIDGENGVSYTVTNPAEGVNYYRASFTNLCGVVAYNSAVTLYYTTCGAREVVTSEAPIVTAPFAAVAYPNPYSESFNLSLTTSSEAKVTVAVYDMTGKLIERREVKLSDDSELHVGDRYPSGVYNIIVTQGEEVKTLRVVKR